MIKGIISQKNEKKNQWSIFIVFNKFINFGYEKKIVFFYASETKISILHH